MFFAPFTCSSIGVATDSSTGRASAPVYVATVWIRGGTISGNCATGSRKTITAPVITKKIAMTIATMGRLMKNFDIALALAAGTRWRFGRRGLRRHRPRLDFHPVRNFLQPLGD